MHQRAQELAQSPEELEDAAEGIAQATEELERQQNMKSHYVESIRALEGDTPDPSAAITSCEAALAIETEETPEREALLALKTCFTSWAEGDAALSAWKGVEALSLYESAQESAERAASVEATAGYHGEKVQLSAAAAGSLSACVTRAKEEIDRKQRLDSALAEGAALLAVRKA